MDLVVGPLRRLLRRVALAVVAAQAVTAGALIAVDSWRKRMRPREATFPRTETADLPLGESVVTVYTYGTVLYEDMLAAIEGARERVLFESFIVKDDEVGQRFKTALIAAAERGVEVFVIYDVFANLVVRRAFFDFPPSVNVVRYPALKPGMLLLDVRKSGRDHRKLLVVDGEIGFVGGYNVGSAYATQWRDTHLRVSGPSAWELENAFVDFWNEQRAPAQPGLPEHGSTLWEPRPARAPQRALAADLPDPWHVPRGDRPRVRAHLDHPAVLHPRPDDAACAAGRSPARRRRPRPRARRLQPRDHGLALAWLLRRVASRRRDDLEIRARDDPRQDDDRRRAVEHDRHREHRSPEPDRQLRGQRRDLRSRRGASTSSGSSPPTSRTRRSSPRPSGSGAAPLAKLTERLLAPLRPLL